MGKKVIKKCANSACGRISKKRRHKNICPDCGAELKAEETHDHRHLKEKNK